jgi:hypothetical protein
VRPGLPEVRRAAGIIAVVLVVAGAAAFYVLAPRLPTRAGPEATTTAGSASPTFTSPGPTNLPTPSPALQQSPSGTVPQQSQSQTNPSMKGRPGVTAVGMSLSAVLVADGSFDVSESVVLQVPISSVQLRVPPIADGGPPFLNMQPRATAMKITAGGQPVTVPGAEVSGDTSLPLSAPATKVHLRYRLTGVTLRTGSPPDRALGALGPLIAGVPSDLPVAISVRGRTVLNLSCPSLRSMGDQACSAGTIGNLRVNRVLVWRHSIVIAQLNLPGGR